MTLPVRPKPRQRGVLAFFYDQGGHWQLDRNDPAPPIPPTSIIDLAGEDGSLEGGTAHWFDWSLLKGSESLGSFWRWLKTKGVITQEERNVIRHLRYRNEHRCHTHRGVTYCY